MAVMMSKRYFLQGYMDKTAGPLDTLKSILSSGPTGAGGGKRLAAEQHEGKRQKILKHVKNMQDFRKRLADRRRWLRGRRLSEEIGEDFMEGKEVPSEIRDAMSKHLVNAWDESTDDVKKRILFKTYVGGFPTPERPTKPNIDLNEKDD